MILREINLHSTSLAIHIYEKINVLLYIEAVTFINLIVKLYIYQI